jgi:hypothetical protein
MTITRAPPASFCARELARELELDPTLRTFCAIPCDSSSTGSYIAISALIAAYDDELEISRANFIVRQLLLVRASLDTNVDASNIFL